MIKMVVFDLDGTILDTLEDLCDGVNYAISKYGYNKITLEECKSYIGHGIRNLIERSIAPSTLYLEETFQTFKKYYTANCNIKTKPYDGIIKLLNDLKNNNIKLGLISNKHIDPLKVLVDYHFNGIFDEIIGDGMNLKRKPDPESIIYILDKYKLNKDEIVYIGDSDADIKTVDNAGVKGLFVSYGFRDYQILSQLTNYPISKTVDELYININKMVK